MAKKKSVVAKSKVEKIVNKGNWFIVKIIERLGPADVKRSDQKYL